MGNPKVYNFQIIKDRWTTLQALLPAPLKKVIFEGAPLTADLPVTEREFIEWLFQVDAAYQSTARYKLLKPFKTDYIANQMNDVRGYFMLKDDVAATSNLSTWSTLSNVQKEKYRSALIYLCQNAQLTRNECIDQFNTAEQNLKLNEMKDLYFPKGRDNYDQFFTIQTARKDVTWNASNPNLMIVPFTNPKNANVMDYLKTNIEDEWKMGDWKLNLNFVDSADDNTTHVVFMAGALPHVNDLAGSIITMDANAPFTEYDVRWTIRHEYGHVLGFPDCYHEFYDEELDAFVSYQLDVTNLMCSRRGHLQPRHFDELKRVYLKQ
jgi:hypothetical protein